MSGQMENSILRLKLLFFVFSSADLAFSPNKLVYSKIDPSPMLTERIIDWQRK